MLQPPHFYGVAHKNRDNNPLNPVQHRRQDIKFNYVQLLGGAVHNIKGGFLDCLGHQQNSGSFDKKCPVWDCAKEIISSGVPVPTT